METLLPLQVIDNILLQYNVGDVLLLVFGIALIAALVVRSRKVLALQTALFGTIFVITPVGELTAASGSFFGEPLAYKFFGLVLLLAGPVLYATAKR